MDLLFTILLYGANVVTLQRNRLLALSVFYLCVSINMSLAIWRQVGRNKYCSKYKVWRTIPLNANPFVKKKLMKYILNEMINIRK